ncbi:MAG: hypothetical protein ACFFF4_17540 [Candidatus Thorarchaeota archaeon]
MSKIKMTPKLVAIVEFDIGVILLIVIASDMTSSLFENVLFIAVLGISLVIGIYCGCAAIMNPTLEWTSTAKRLNSIGASLMLLGFPVSNYFQGLTFGFGVTLTGIILTLISTLHPSAIKEAKIHACPNCGSELFFERIDGSFIWTCKNCDNTSNE